MKVHFLILLKLILLHTEAKQTQRQRYGNKLETGSIRGEAIPLSG